jgi:DNA-binding PadR family transcriptional regulator
MSDITEEDLTRYLKAIGSPISVVKMDLLLMLVNKEKTAYEVAKEIKRYRDEIKKRR